MVTTTEAPAEEDESEVSTMTTEDSIEEAEDTTCLSERLQWVNIYNDRGASVFTGSPRYQQRQQMRQLGKHKIQRVWVKVSDGRGTSVFTGRGYWQQQKCCSNPRWDNLPTGHQLYPLKEHNLGYMYWDQKHSSEWIEKYQYMQHKVVHVLICFFCVLW